MWNDLEEPVLERYPEFQAVRRALLASGASEVRLSGSGSAFFAVYPSGAEVPTQIADLPDGCRFLSVTTGPRGSRAEP
jgi:4-diphosphocytidyl-2C-methyl-D-erythritol kinase